MGGAGRPAMNRCSRIDGSQVCRGEVARGAALNWKTLRGMISEAALLARRPRFEKQA